jgi:hypothetical protein
MMLGLLLARAGVDVLVLVRISVIVISPIGAS